MESNVVTKQIGFVVTKKPTLFPVSITTTKNPEFLRDHLEVIKRFSIER